MKNKIKSSREKGQAIMEMCICLLPILVIMLGMIFISGLGISNIRALIEAKGNAELASRSQNAIGGYGNNIHYWDYGEGEGEDNYPFTADDQSINFYPTNSGYGTEVLISEQLNDSIYSEETTQDYIFMRADNLSNIKNIDDNFAQNPPETMIDAAELVKGTADSNDSNTENIKNLSFSFTHLFGIEAGDLDLNKIPANAVYYPALPTETSNSSNSEGGEGGEDEESEGSTDFFG